MELPDKLIWADFNYAYNPRYYIPTARLSRYRRLQERCLSKLKLKDNDRVLCVGLGTGNELQRLLQMNPNLNIVGIDRSGTAIRKARKKALALGKDIRLSTMDARHLQFARDTFDEVICIHLMDFLPDRERATAEILRVLKEDGQFVITYPSGAEGVSLGIGLLKDGIGASTGNGAGHGFLAPLIRMMAGTVYLPLLLRTHKKVYSRPELTAMMERLGAADLETEEDTVYRDLIIYGRKAEKTTGGIEECVLKTGTSKR
jgi:SAM-dependent methyltransferase